MHKKISMCLFLICMLPLFAIDIVPYWNFGDIKIGVGVKKSTPKAVMNLNLAAFTFYFPDYDTGINFSLNPFYIDLKIYPTSGTISNADIYVMSLLNAELAYNPLYKKSNIFALNFFVSTHCIDFAAISRFQINAGLEFAITLESSLFKGKKYPLKSKLLSIRSGLKYTERQPLFFCDIGIALESFLFIFQNQYNDALKQKNDKRNPY